MKHLMIVLFLSFASLAFAQDKESVIEELIDQIISTNEDIQRTEEYLSKSREELIDSFKPDYKGNVSSKVLAMQEQLYNDVKASSLYLGYIEGTRKAYAEDLRSEFSTPELVELLEMIRSPLFERLKSIQLSGNSQGMKFIEQWTKENEILVEEFMKRDEAINYELKIDLMTKPKQRDQEEK
ncbi:hypothetical protein [Pleionea sediminis]|uniref:hypothetical protein n=1 Tax=Pleionea sediminis TaxID=2569479 RepID=UPI0011857A51|nr:hypothetical protein [Pleionea sediminis]